MRPALLLRFLLLRFLLTRLLLPHPRLAPYLPAQEEWLKTMLPLLAQREKMAFSVMKRCPARRACSCARYILHSSSRPFSK